MPNTIIWLGPRKDWEEFRSPFLAYEKFGIEEVEDAGLVSYETIFVMTKKSIHSVTDGSASFSTSQIEEI